MGKKEKKQKKEKRGESKIRYFFRNFIRKQRLSIRDQRSDEEVLYVYISPARILAALLGSLLLLSGVTVLLVVYTSIFDNLPGYPGRKTRTMLVEGIVRLDSLENELRTIISYGESVSLIMDGKTPVVAPVPGDTELGGEKPVLRPSAADSLLRRQLEAEDGRYSIVRDDTPVVGVSEGIRNLLSPVNGKVTTFFSPSTGMNGVGIRLTEPQQIVAVDDGTVIMSLWTPEDNYIMQIFHKDNNITIYRNATQLLKSVGERVSKGEVIGYMDRTDMSGGNNDEFEFELWSNGQPVDPQKYILF